MIIALDIDGTIRDFIGKLNECYDRDFPNETRTEVVNTWELDKHYSIGVNIYEYAFHNNGYEIMKDANLYNGAYEFILNLMYNLEDHTYLATTQSDWDCVRGTIEWIGNKNIPHSGLFISPDKTLLKADILIDDYHKNLNAWAKTGRKAICIERPWNRERTDWHKNVDFGNGYEGVLDVIKYYKEHPEELRNV